MTDSVLFVESLDSAERVPARAAASIPAAADRAIAGRGRFDPVLAGGRTPVAAYTLPARMPADWERWHILFGDERCLPAGDPGRNDTAAARAWLDRVPIPPGIRHPIPAELGAERAVEAYERIVQQRLPFDPVLLGMGEDGHTASPFPGCPIPWERLAMPLHRAPKPPPERVSLTPAALSSGAEMPILVTGAGNRAPSAAWAGGERLPVAPVASPGGARVLTDRDTAADLGPERGLPHVS